MKKTNYRIHTSNNRIKYAGTDQDSWLTLEQARQLTDISKGETIHEYKDHIYHMWEVC